MPESADFDLEKGPSLPMAVKLCAGLAGSYALKILLGRGRAKKGMFLGEVEEGELEVGQVSASINEILSVSQIIDEIMIEFNAEKQRVSEIKF
jgi:enoyl-[acyl-carrier protein] reductase II